MLAKLGLQMAEYIEKHSLENLPLRCSLDFLEDLRVPRPDDFFAHENFEMKKLREINIQVF